ncbi:hypothetical protein jhhlp_008649 [Lomentospora prolificans]|uniref:NAD-dependent epimerase/dehydratase domain-containing protein n=1 Tax=Lomentospora prolificans TaxID=41688 RepID=A0A2N3MYM0_9PEZI|nr:hypothetical protein jhhlp_008649 [Lomentospora prolificans]
MSGPKILITGATGYIGGSVLTTLLTSEDAGIKSASISALVRKQEQADKLQQNGVQPILFSGLDDTELLTKVASEHDIVINTASAFHNRAAAAIIEGLARRKKDTGKEVHLVHTSRTSSLGDQPVSGGYRETRVFSDKDDIYSYLRAREDREPYAQRTTDLVVFEKGIEASVRTYILMSPTIYAVGDGFFNRTSIQIDTIIRAAYRQGYTSVIGTGAGEWDHVHIMDLKDLYHLILQRLIAGEDLAYGKDGICFNETGVVARGLGEGGKGWQGARVPGYGRGEGGVTADGSGQGYGEREYGVDGAGVRVAVEDAVA